MNPRPSPSDGFPLPLRWLPVPGLPVPVEQWRRLWDGRIEAWYRDREELALCVALMEAIAKARAPADPAEAWRWTDYNGV
jgi:hypothetical protein